MKKSKIQVISLFDGISCGKIALNRLGIPSEYHAFETDKTAKLISKSNHKDITYYGDVRTLTSEDFPNTDLLLGGSPCQNLSSAMKDREGLKGAKSSLFFEYVRVLKEVRPKYFLFENVGGMKKEDKDIITSLLGVEPIKIDSKLVSGALRNRLYWTNIPNQTQPIDRKITLQSILESGYTGREKARALLASDSRPLRTKEKMLHRFFNTGFTTLIFDDKNMTPENCRYMTQIELERCMTLPVGYTQVVKRDVAAEYIGNGWTVEVIVHLLQNLTKVLDSNL